MKKSSTTKKRIVAQIVVAILACSLVFLLGLAPDTRFWKIILALSLAFVVFGSAPILSHLSHKELEEDEELNEMKRRFIEALSKTLEVEETEEDFT